MVKISLRQMLIPVLFILQLAPTLVNALDFAIMPVRSKAKTEELYKPLMVYLSKKTGQKINLKAYNNFVNYWQDMRTGKFDFALDAAHFVDYRVKTQDNQVLVKIRDQVSFSLVSTEANSILDTDELIGKYIACLPPPSRGNLEIDKFFSHPIRQPRKREVKNYEEGVKLMKSGKVHAAMMPTAMLGAFPELLVIETTELWPHMGVTASAKIPTKVKSAVAKALLSLGRKENKEGAKILSKIGFVGFQPTDHSAYDGYGSYLKSYGRF